MYLFANALPFLARSVSIIGLAGFRRVVSKYIGEDPAEIEGETDNG
jgi:hypothetical protein